MNRYIFDVEVRYSGRVIGTEDDEVEAKVREHIRKHPERLDIEVRKKESCDLLEEWEVKP